MWHRTPRPARAPVTPASLLFSAFVTLLFWITVGALIVEAVLFATGNRPITSYVRSWVQDVPPLVFPFILAFGVFIGHFFWGPRQGAARPDHPRPLPLFGKEVPR